MSSKTKIIVLHMKEIIYTCIFAIFIILIIGLLYLMFSESPGAASEEISYFIKRAAVL